MDSVVNLIFKTVGTNKLDAAQRSLDKVNNTIKKTNGALPGASKGFAGMGNAAKGATGGVRALGAAVGTALGPIIGITTALGALTKSVNTAFERDVAENRLKNLTKTTADYEYALAAAREAQQNFGFTLTEATQLLGDAQARIGTLGYNVEQVNQVFTGFNVIARQAGVSSEDAAGAFTQLAQGMSAGALQGDELRSILERMPAVTKVLADEMGQPVEKIKELGSAGAITSDIIFKALSKAAEGAGDLDGKLTPLQKGFMALKSAIENAFNTIGEIIQPILIPAINAATATVEKFTEIWQYVSQVLFPQVAKAFRPVIDRVRELFKDFDWNAFGALITQALVKPLEIAAKGLESMVPVFTWVLDRMKDIANNPVIKTLTDAVGGLLQMLGLLSDPVKEFTEEVKKSEKSTKELAGNISNAKEQTEGAAEAATKLAAAQKTAADQALEAAKTSEVIRQNNIKLLQAEFDLRKTLLDIEKENAQRELEKAKTTQAVTKAAEKLYKITVQQAKLDLQIAKTKIDAAVNELKAKHTLVNATIKQAQAERAVLAAKGESTVKADIAIKKTMQQAVELQKMVATQETIARLQKQQADEIYKQTIETAKLTKERQIQEGKERISKELNEQKTAEIEKQTTALQKQTSAIASQNSALARQSSLRRQSQSFEIGGKSTTTVKSIARTDLPASVNQKIIDSGRNFIGIRAATTEANRLREEARIAAEGMKVFEEQLNSTNKTYREMMNTVESTVEGSAKWIASYAKEMYNKTKSVGNATDGLATAIDGAAAAFKSGSKVKSGKIYHWDEVGKNIMKVDGNHSNRYASGGYVNTPTRAMIGEGGEGEYIIPESKMYEAMQRFGRGQRGQSVVPSTASVNVNWNGEMIQMDGKAYIEKSQMPGLIQTAVTETMNTLHRNARARAFVGI